MKLSEEERLKVYLGYFYDLLTPEQREVEKQRMLKIEKEMRRRCMSEIVSC